MNLKQLQAIEELHQPITAVYYSHDGTREIDVEVCETCDSEPMSTYAAEYPCSTLIDAQHDYEEYLAKQNAGNISQEDIKHITEPNNK